MIAPIGATLTIKRYFIAKLRDKKNDNYMKTFKIEEEHIQLIQLLKASRLAQSGGEAQQLVVEGLVRVNGALESRKRAKLRAGDVVEYNNQSIKIVSE